jgi:uncharacterized membrane protein YoaK (UPF0700 family)
MPPSTDSATHHPSTSPSDPLPDVARLEAWLPALLSVIAGTVDVIGFLSFKLFTAHVTGNIVLIAALLVRGGPPNMAEILAVPVFIIAVAAVWLIASALDRRGPALARPLLVVQFLLLSCALILAVISHPTRNPDGLMAVFVAMTAVSAMACQYSLLRLAVPGTPSTAVMTGNLTNAVLSLLDSLSRNRPLGQDANARLKKTLKLLGGFFAGCVAGAAAVSVVGSWAWSVPVVLAGAAVQVPQLGRTFSTPPHKDQQSGTET